MLLQHGVMAQASARPDAVAIVFEDTRITYGALDATSNGLARLLLDAGCQRGDRIALLMPKSPMAIVAILGVLKCDATYVPMDPASPPTRLAKMLEISDCRFVLAAGAVEERLARALAEAQLRKPPTVGWLDEYAGAASRPTPGFTLRDLAFYPTTPRVSVSTAEQAAHILFTSGTTGTPKGVMITHASVVHLIRWALRHFQIGPEDRISQHSPLRFDVSTFDIFGALWAGAELHLVPSHLNLLPHKLAQFMRDGELTQWFSVPSVLNLMAKFDVVRPGDFPRLKRVLFAGEVLPTPTLIHWMRRLPHAQFTNLFGPTETTIVSSHYTVPACPEDEREPIPIGTACEGEELLAFDEELRPVPDGEIGELYIRGAGVSPGYWRDAERTRQSFVPCPGAANLRERMYRTGDLVRRTADGNFHFVGRRDTQIKSRGYRIELGEIEAALHSLTCLRESAVVAVQSDGFEGWLIGCAYVPAADHDVTLKQLRVELAKLLPNYMFPARWLRYDALPRNDNGKVDRPALKAAFLHTVDHETPPRATRALQPNALRTNPINDPAPETGP